MIVYRFCCRIALTMVPRFFGACFTGSLERCRLGVFCASFYFGHVAHEPAQNGLDRSEICTVFAEMADFGAPIQSEELQELSVCPERGYASRPPPGIFWNRPWVERVMRTH